MFFFLLTWSSYSLLCVNIGFDATVRISEKDSSANEITRKFNNFGKVIVKRSNNFFFLTGLNRTSQPTRGVPQTATDHTSALRICVKYRIEFNKYPTQK